MIRPCRPALLTAALACMAVHAAVLGADTPSQAPGPTGQPGAQATARAAAPVSVGLPGFDVGAGVAWYHRGGADFSDQWSSYNSLWLGLEAGRYWTEHLKTEVGVASTDETRVYVRPTQVRIGTQQYYESGEDYFRSSRLTVLQLYQFGHNAWFHPFCGAGVQVIRERSRGERYRYPVNPGPSGVYLQPDMVSTPPRTEVVVRGAVLGGFKAYLSRRAFLRSDLLVGVRHGFEEAVVRFGVGVDF